MSAKLFRDGSVPSLYADVNAPTEDKEKIRKRLEADMAKFFRSGGEIERVDESQRTEKTALEMYRNYQNVRKA